MNRRDFLDARRLVRPAAQVFGVLGETPAPEAPNTGEGVLLRFARRAMATTFEIIFPFGTPEAHRLAETALDLIDRLEAQLTIYRDTSDVSRINAHAFRAPTVVEIQLFELLAEACDLHRATGGAVDVATGTLIKAWGFQQRKPHLPSPEALAIARDRAGMKYVTIDSNTYRVYFTRPGVELNLGAIGKGYALDRVISLLKQANIQHVLVHGGHSSVYALGDEPGQTRGWRVGLTHPHNPERSLGELRLVNRALATSAATHQYLEYEGRKLGHIIDPRTGWPAEGLSSVTVTASTAAQADALATAFFVMSPEETRSFCEAHPDVGAVLLPCGANSVIVCGRAGAEFSAADMRRITR